MNTEMPRPVIRSNYQISNGVFDFRTGRLNKFCGLPIDPCTPFPQEFAEVANVDLLFVLIALSVPVRQNDRVFDGVSLCLRYLVLFVFERRAEQSQSPPSPLPPNAVTKWSIFPTSRAEISVETSASV